MTHGEQCQVCIPGCNAAVPPELEAESLCVSHFVLDIEQACAGLRREAALETTSVPRRQEISNYAKATAIKLCEAATGRMRLPDELKKRVLTTILNLMNLQESIDRAMSRFGQAETASKPSSPIPVLAGFRE